MPTEENREKSLLEYGVHERYIREQCMSLRDPETIFCQNIAKFNYDIVTTSPIQLYSQPKRKKESTARIPLTNQTVH